eukprot:15465247-Alexandrium_andersonii.AAC.1
MDELERFQLEEAIRASEARTEGLEARPADSSLQNAAGASPRAAKLLKDGEEIAWILVAQRMAWERHACNPCPQLTKATLGAVRCRPRKLRGEHGEAGGIIDYEG